MLRRVLLLTLLLSLAAPAAAQANARQVTILQDDAQLLNGATQGAALDRARSLGVDMVRTILRWGDVAPSSRPADPSDPRAYDWRRWDALVDAARARGIDVLLNVSAPAPSWGRPRGRIPFYAPDVGLFGAFARAAGAHFRTRVGSWSIYNEPNLNTWLRPGGTAAAIRYRRLYRAGVTGLRRSGNGRDRILFGELAPVRNYQTTAPTTFMRSVFCLDARGRRLTGRAARRLACRGRFAPLAATGVAHHPYTNALACTPRCKGRPGDVTIAGLGRLTTVIDQAVRAGRLSRAARANLWLTEFGFQSNPPNPGPISLAEQAHFINWGEWLGYRNGRVRSYAQFELADPPGEPHFNTGLFFSSGAAKPSAGAFRTPLFVAPAGRRVRVWGGARPGGRHRVTIEARGRSGPFRRVTTVRTSPAGYFSLRLRPRRAWRLTWRDGTVTRVSRVAGLTR